MPNQRAPDQHLVSFWISGELRDALLEGLDKTGKSQSQFAREALVEELNRASVEAPIHLGRPPSRLGKGGPRRAGKGQRGSAYPGPSSPHIMNDDPAINSGGATAKAKALMNIAEELSQPVPKSGLKQKAAGPIERKRAPKPGGGKGS